MVDPLRVEARGPADHAVNLIAEVEQQLSQVRAVLPGDAGDQRAFDGSSVLRRAQTNMLLASGVRFPNRITWVPAHATALARSESSLGGTCGMPCLSSVRATSKPWASSSLWSARG